jgi:hypothetical protein
MTSDWSTCLRLSLVPHAIECLLSKQLTVRQMPNASSSMFGMFHDRDGGCRWYLVLLLLDASLVRMLLDWRNAKGPQDPPVSSMLEYYAVGC